MAGSGPTTVRTTVQLLLSARGHSALTPELNAALPTRRLFPAGTTFVPLAGTWHQAGAYANLTGVLRAPGHPPGRAEIGFVRRRGHWFVTFEAGQ